MMNQLIKEHIVKGIVIGNSAIEARNQQKFKKLKLNVKIELAFLVAWEDCCKRDQRRNNEIRWEVEKPMMVHNVMCGTEREALLSPCSSSYKSSDVWYGIGFIVKATYV